MKQSNTLIRKLNNTEQAFTISNEAFPLCVVCVLHLTSGPDIQELKIALKQLQSRHILLQAGITKAKGEFYFHQLTPAPPIELKVVDRSDANIWRSISEKALNTTFDIGGPLMKSWYLPVPEKTDCELIVCFHHAIIDRISARLILHELLSLMGGISLPGSPQSTVISSYPPPYRKGNIVPRLIAFAGRQIMEEWRYKKEGASSPIPEHSRNASLSLRISPSISRKLSVRIGREGLHLNSVLLAAISQVILQHKHTNKDARLARVISFADLRSSFFPSVPEQELGCYISMLRFSIPISRDQSVSQFAANIQRAIFRARRRDEVFVMAKMSKYLIKMALTLRIARLGVSALSFIGTLDLEPQYGLVRLHNVMTFITNNRFGPEISAFGKILFGAIGLDFTYLTNEWDAEQAKQIVKEIKEILEKMANLP